MIQMPAILFTFFGIFADVNVFLTVMILIFGMFGFLSGKLSVAIFGSFLAFIHITQETDLFIFDNLLYVFIVLIVMIVAFRVITFSTANEGETP